MHSQHVHFRLSMVVCLYFVFLNASASVVSDAVGCELAYLTIVSAVRHLALGVPAQ
jgi:hypothetical protein